MTAALLNTHVRDNLLETAPAKVTTAGDTIYGSGANAIARLAGGASNSLKRYRMNLAGTAPEWFSKAYQEDWQESDLVKTSSTTYSATEISIAIPASVDVHFELFVLISCNSTADAKFRMTGPSGIAWPSAFGLYVDETGAVQTGSVDPSADITVEAGSNLYAGAFSMLLHGAARNGATPGNIVVEFAQRVSNAGGSTFWRGSNLKLWYF